jgi:hypothetical protein
MKTVDEFLDHNERCFRHELDSWFGDGKYNEFTFHFWPTENSEPSLNLFDGDLDHLPDDIDDKFIERVKSSDGSYDVYHYFCGVTVVRRPPIVEHENKSAP